jgi:hypothetical protein
MTEPSSELPAGLEDAFAAAAGELGMATTAWLFVRAVARSAGDDAVGMLAERLGQEFTPLDSIARGWLDGQRELIVDPAPVLDAIGNATRLVVIGVEASFLDALLERAPPSLKVALVAHSPFPVDWNRVLDNYAGRVERVDLDTFQHWAGGKSALLTFAYGRQDEEHTAVLPLWFRACGADVRAQFRALVAWDVLGGPRRFYPRWLAEVDTASFTHFVR